MWSVCAGGCPSFGVVYDGNHSGSCPQLRISLVVGGCADRAYATISFRHGRVGVSGEHPVSWVSSSLCFDVSGHGSDSLGGRSTDVDSSMGEVWSGCKVAVDGIICWLILFLISLAGLISVLSFEL